MSLFFNKNDPKNATLFINTERWEPGEHNILYVIQYQYGCAELDNIMENIARLNNATIIPINMLLTTTQGDYFIDDYDDIPTDFKVIAKEYLRDPYIRKMDVSLADPREYEILRARTTRWAINYAKAHKNKLFIIEDIFSELFDVYLKKIIYEPFVIPSTKFSPGKQYLVHKQVESLRKHLIKSGVAVPSQVF